MTKVRPTILVLGTFSDEGAIEHRYVRGFQKECWNVQCLEIHQPLVEKITKNIISKAIYRFFPSIFMHEINKKIVDDVRNIKPDVILVFKGMTLFPETISKLKEHSQLICNYNPDHPLEIYSRGGTNRNIIQGVSHYDLFFTYASKIAQKISLKHNIPAYTIPFGYDPILVERYSNSFKDSLSDTFLFVGAWDKEREHDLETLGRDDVEIFGDVEWSLKTGKNQLVNRNYRHKKLYDEALYSKIRSSMGVINIMRQQNIVEGSHNMRTFEVPGYGGLLLSQFTEEQASFFEPDKEAIYYQSLDELNDKMNYLKNHPGTISEIKSNALARSLNSNYSYDHRAKKILSIISEHLN